MLKDQRKYLLLLSEKYPSIQAVCKEIINLNAILNLPKGTEHFISDLHGEYEAFCHILNNCSGVIREKLDQMFASRLSKEELREICTLIYYPVEKLTIIKSQGKNHDDWYRMILNHLIEFAKLLSSKYTRSKVKKALPDEFSYIIDELLHAQPDEDDNQVLYHQKILDTIIKTDSANDFIVELSELIKRLAVDHLHIIGDIFDRGGCADKILDLLIDYHSLDIQWGNHDIVWMGAVAGSEACMAAVVYTNIKYQTMEVLENGYGISLRTLALFGERTYQNKKPMEAALKAISVILFKLEGQIIEAHPEYKMEGRRLLHKIDYVNQSISIDDKVYALNDVDFPTIDYDNPYQLSLEEKEIIEEIKNAFTNSKRLRRHIDFLYEKGAIYQCYNSNLLYHGCVPLDQDGNFSGVIINEIVYKGKAYLDYADKIARRAYSKECLESDLDFMWYLWCGRKSPLSGRNIKTFERTFISAEEAWEEEEDDYYSFYHMEKTCNMILREFELYSEYSHIVNGHTPVRTTKGELPVRACGKMIVIDGGMCKNYHEKTGIAGYTLIYNSHGMRIKSHQPFVNIYKALRENVDIESNAETIETLPYRMMVEHTDDGKQISQTIDDLYLLLNGYRQGEIEIRKKNKKE